MKKIFHLLSPAAVVLFFQTTAFSQITLTNADLANYFGPGKSWFQIESPDTVLMNIGSVSSSTSQTWSAPTVHYKDTLRLDNVLPSSTPYSANFPGAMYAQEETMMEGPLTLEYYAYYKLSNDSLYILGSVQHETGSFSGVKIDSSIIIHSVQLGFVLPLHIGEVIAHGADTVYSQGTDIDVNTETNNYDAYGTLTLPNGSFPTLRESISILTKVYLGGILSNSSTSYSITWVTESGNQLSVQVDSITSGSVMVHSAVFTYIGTTPATLVKASAQLPGSFTLSQNYPNPFNPSTQIQFSIPQAGFVSLKVYDMLGREVATLVHQELTPSSYSITWDAANVASGVYLYKLDAGNYSIAKKMVLMK
jgi:hypothetical protein